MQTDFLKLYLELNKTLARTLSIKIDTHADSINTYLQLRYGNLTKPSPTGLKVSGDIRIEGQIYADDTITVIANHLVDVDGLGTFHYQWMSNDTKVGADSISYKTTLNDLGGYIYCLVSYTNGKGVLKTFTSNVVGPIGIVNKNDKASWKYYKNLAGEYHITDTPMEVTSLDTLETIIFSKEVLKEHPATVDAYQYQTRYYQSLILQYPRQEELILGILYPADKTHAIQSDNGSIVSYPSDLVEPQEATLIVELESYIKRYLVRWDVGAFGLSESLYNCAQFAVMCLNIYSKLVNLRLKRCKTNEAHSFHIREYLASHGRLDRYMPYMSLEQVLYLYRDIRYIERNAGKSTQFKTLINKLLTKRYIPIGEFSVRHLSEFDDKYYPTINVRRKGLNPLYNVPEVDYFTIEQLYKKEAKLAIDNIDYLDHHSNEITKLFQNSSSSIVQTKDLESSMYDYSNAVPDPLEKVLLRQWAHLVTTDRYQTYVTFKNPVTGDDVMLNTLDAFIYMYYVFLRSIGLTIVSLPPYINIKHRIEPKVTVDRMLSVVDKKFTDLPSMATQILARQPLITVFHSVKNFFNKTHTLYEEGLLHWYTVSSIQDHYKRALVSNMILTMYADTEIVFPSETKDMDNWLASKELPVYDLSYTDAQKLIKNIFMASTGLTVDSTKLLKNIQAALIGALTQLSSYTVQFSKEISDPNILVLNWAAIRLGDPQMSLSADEYLPNEVSILGYKGKQSRHVHIESMVDKNFNEYKVSTSTHFEINSTVEAIAKLEVNKTFEIHNRSFFVDVTYPGFDLAISSQTAFAGWETYLALTDQQKSQIKSIYP